MGFIDGAMGALSALLVWSIFATRESMFRTLDEADRKQVLISTGAVDFAMVTALLVTPSLIVGVREKAWIFLFAVIAPSALMPNVSMPKCSASAGS